MSFNFSELQQKADKVLHNSDEFVRRWIDFVTAPAGNVTLEYYDKNGNLQTAVFSNRNKLVQDFIANVNSVMDRTFYVNQANGNDGNDGSETAPFKSIFKAVNSIPSGGRVDIVLLNDHELANEPDFISITNKQITLNLNGHALIKTNTYKRFKLLNGISSIFFSTPYGTNASIIVDNSSSTFSSYEKALVHCEASSFSFIQFNWDASRRLSISTDTHLIRTTRGISVANIIGCDFTITNGATGLYVNAVNDGGNAEAYGTGNTGIDGTNLIALSGRISYY